MVQVLSNDCGFLHFNTTPICRFSSSSCLLSLALFLSLPFIQSLSHVVRLLKSIVHFVRICIDTITQTDECLQMKLRLYSVALEKRNMYCIELLCSCNACELCFGTKLLVLWLLCTFTANQGLFLFCSIHISNYLHHHCPKMFVCNEKLSFLFLLCLLSLSLGIEKKRWRKRPIAAWLS